jgi:hypothetical protein
MEEVEWVYVMPKQRTTEEVGVNYSIGDLVSVKYCHVEKEQLKFMWEPGIVTDRAGATDGTGEYKVLTLDGQHDWSPLSDLLLIQRAQT